MFTAYRNNVAICSGTDFKSTKAGAMEYLHSIYSYLGYTKWEYNESNRHYELRDSSTGTILAHIPGLTAKR